METKFGVCFLLYFFFYSKSVSSQHLPSVDLAIQNITQQNSMWCWAAVAQQVIYWKKKAAPSQCELVAMANNTSPKYCCQIQMPQNCNLPGNFQQIQSLIYYYGGTISALAPPADPLIIYNTLVQGKTIILFLQTQPNIGHFIVLRGMEWIITYNGLQALLYVNDPMSVYTKPIPFINLLAIWRAAIVVN